MRVDFEKYQGAGNDFIILNGITSGIKLSQSQIESMCNRHFGVGADGLIIIEKAENYDFFMRYFNSDGLEGTMCGNGGRCAANFAYRNTIAGEKIKFLAIDGVHYAEIKDENVSISMKSNGVIKKLMDGYFLDTGSPHFVKFVDNIDNINITEKGKEIADELRFSPNRTNVNFVEIKPGQIKTSTFERGVENETLACGTGAVAIAIALHQAGIIKVTNVKLFAKGGVLKVSFDHNNNNYTNIKLEGPAEFVFKGCIYIE